MVLQPAVRHSVSGEQIAVHLERTQTRDARAHATSSTAAATAAETITTDEKKYTPSEVAEEEEEEEEEEEMSRCN